MLTCRKPTLGSTYDMGHGSRGGSLKERERDGGEIEGGGQGEGEGEREKKKGRTRERGRGGNITAGCHSLSWVLILPEWAVYRICHDQHHTCRKQVLASVRIHKRAM